MTEWVVRRWTRYGHERLYAETPGGTALGYFDVKTGRHHSDDLSNLPLLERAIADHLQMHAATPAVEPDSPTVVESPVPSKTQPETPAPAAAPQAPPARHDLSTNRPGSAAREQALAQRQAQGTVKHVLARLVGARTEERAWRIGADGEEAVAARLLALGPEWRVLHAIGVGTQGSDIDHLAIGPSGVFTINAKHHPHASIWVGGDTFMVNGRRVPYIRNSRHEARRAGRLLTEQTGFPVTATGVIAVMGARKGYKIKSQPEDGQVVVVTRRGIARVLRSRPSRLSPREVDAIFTAARRSTTWQS